LRREFQLEFATGRVARELMMDDQWHSDHSTLLNTISPVSMTTIFENPIVRRHSI